MSENIVRIQGSAYPLDIWWIEGYTSDKRADEARYLSEIHKQSVFQGV